MLYIFKNQHRPLWFTLICLTLGNHPTLAADFPGSEGDRYRACIALTTSKPEDAFETALAWRDRGGGFPARHCAALALVAMKQYDDAAARLEQLAQDMQKVGSDLQAEVLGQAGNAWLLAGQTDRARGNFTAGLGIQPNHPDLLIDRARAAAALGDFPAAIADLDRAISVDPRRAEAFAFRASAKRQTNDPRGAKADVAEALKRDPDEIEALLERGILRAAEGDQQGARADWLRVVTEGAGTPAAEAAQSNLEKMDLKPN